jgi:hypothetical protein
MQIVCNLTDAPDTGPERMAEYQRLFGSALLGRERTADGIRFRLRADEGVETWARDLAAREKACCPFFDFHIGTDGAEVRWDVRVPDDDVARAVLDEFYAIPDTAQDGIEGLENRLEERGLRIVSNGAGTIKEVPGADPRPDRV